MIRRIVSLSVLTSLLFVCTGCWRAVGNGKITVAAGVAHPIKDVEDLHAKALAKLDALEKGNALDPLAITSRRNASFQDTARIRGALRVDLASVPSAPSSAEAPAATAPDIPQLPEADKSALATEKFSALAAAAGMASTLEDSPTDLITGTRDIYETLIPARLRFTFDSLRANGYEFYQIPLTLAVQPGNRTSKNFIADIHFDFEQFLPAKPGTMTLNLPLPADLWLDYETIRRDWIRRGVLDFHSESYASTRARLEAELRALETAKAEAESKKREQKKEQAKEQTKELVDWAERLKGLVQKWAALDTRGESFDAGLHSWASTPGDRSASDTARRWSDYNWSGLALLLRDLEPALGRSKADRRRRLEIRNVITEIAEECRIGRDLLKNAPSEGTDRETPETDQPDAIQAKKDEIKKLDAAFESFADEIRRLNALRYELAALVLPIPHDENCSEPLKSPDRIAHANCPPASELQLDQELMIRSLRGLDEATTEGLRLKQTSKEVSDESRKIKGRMIENQKALEKTLPAPDKSTESLETPLSKNAEGQEISISDAPEIKAHLKALLEGYGSYLGERATEFSIAGTPPPLNTPDRTLDDLRRAVHAELTLAYANLIRYVGLIHGIHRIESDSVHVLTISPLRQFDHRAESLARRIQREYAFQLAASGPLGQVGTGAGNLDGSRLKRLEDDLATITKEPVLTGYPDTPSSFGWRIHPTLALDKNGKNAEKFMDPGPRDVMIVMAVRRRSWEGARDLIHDSITLPELHSIFRYRARWIREGHRAFHLRRELPPENRSTLPYQYYNPNYGNWQLQPGDLGVGFVNLSLPSVRTRPELSGKLISVSSTIKSESLIQITGKGFGPDTRAIIHDQEIKPQTYSPTRLFIAIDPAKFPAKKGRYGVNLTDGPGRQTLLAQVIEIEGSSKSRPKKAGVKFEGTVQMIQPHMSLRFAYEGAGGVNELTQPIQVRIGDVTIPRVNIFEKKDGKFGVTVPVLPGITQGLVAVTVDIGTSQFHVGEVVYVNPNWKEKSGSLILSTP